MNTPSDSAIAQAFRDIAEQTRDGWIRFYEACELRDYVEERARELDASRGGADGLLHSKAEVRERFGLPHPAAAGELPEVLIQRAYEAVDYSHNFATAKPNIGGTEKEHILGLCRLVDDLRKAVESRTTNAGELPEAVEYQYRFWNDEAKPPRWSSWQAIRQGDYQANAANPMEGREVRALHTADQLRAAVADAEMWKAQVHDEIAANLTFREAGGAKPDEDMQTFCARLIAERDEAVAAVAGYRRDAEGLAPVKPDMVDGELSVASAIEQVVELFPSADRAALRTLAACFTHHSIHRFAALANLGSGDNKGSAA